MWHPEKHPCSPGPASITRRGPGGGRGASGSQLAAPCNDAVVGLGSASLSGRLGCAGGLILNLMFHHPRVGGMEGHPLGSIAPGRG